MPKARLLFGIFDSMCNTFPTKGQLIGVTYNQRGASQVVLVVKKSPANAGDVRDANSIPGSGRFPGATATRSGILAWRIHGQRSLAGYSP